MAVPAIPGFTLEGRIATGRHGTVWAARRDADGLEAAVKTVSLARVANASRFLREADALAAIDHPHVVRCLASGRSGEVLWLALERAAGSLADELRRGPLADAAVLAAGRDAAAGLAELHRLGLVHRDLTPANLLRLRDDRVVVADFGLVLGDHERVTRAGEVLGTPAYLAPEQAAGGAVDARSDIHALGAVLYALATGQPPWQGESAWGLLTRISAGPFPDPRAVRDDLPPGLRAIILAATATDPAERYPEVGQLGEDCAAVLAGGVPQHAGTVRGRRRSPEAAPAIRLRGARPTILAAAIALAVGTLAGLLLFRPAPADPQRERLQDEVQRLEAELAAARKAER